jgi:hypothetical protein
LAATYERSSQGDLVVAESRRYPVMMATRSSSSVVVTMATFGNPAVALRRADAYVKSPQRKLAAAQHGAFGA